MEIFKNISDRERQTLIPASIFAALLIILLAVDLPLYKKGIEAARKVKEEDDRLKSMISMGREYISAKYETEDIRDRAFKGEGAALAGLDALVNRSGLKKKLSSLKPTSTPVADGIKKIKAEIAVEKISMTDLLRLINAMEADRHPVSIERISSKATYEDPSMFNATLIVNTVEKD